MNIEDDNLDEPLRRVISAQPFPKTPPIADQVARRVIARLVIARNTFWRTTIAAAAVAALVALAMLFSRQPSSTPGSLAQSEPQPARTTASTSHSDPACWPAPPPTELDPRTLDTLFAPPPVDSLAVLNQRLDAAFRVLK